MFYFDINFATIFKNKIVCEVCATLDNISGCSLYLHLRSKTDCPPDSF